MLSRAHLHDLKYSTNCAQAATKLFYLTFPPLATTQGPITTTQVMVNKSENSRFIYMPASSLASRRIIEQSSYTTTPDQSSTDPTPPCGEAMYKRSLDDEKIKTVDSILQMKQISDTEIFEPPSEKVEGNEKNTRKRAIDRVCSKKGKRTNEENNSLAPKLSSGLTPQILQANKASIERGRQSNRLAFISNQPLFRPLLDGENKSLRLISPCTNHVVLWNSSVQKKERQKSISFR